MAAGPPEANPPNEEDGAAVFLSSSVEVAGVDAAGADAPNVKGAGASVEVAGASAGFLASWSFFSVVAPKVNPPEGFGASGAGAVNEKPVPLLDEGAAAAGAGLAAAVVVDAAGAGAVPPKLKPPLVDDGAGAAPPNEKPVPAVELSVVAAGAVTPKEKPPLAGAAVVALSVVAVVLVVAAPNEKPEAPMAAVPADALLSVVAAAVEVVVAPNENPDAPIDPGASVGFAVSSLLFSLSSLLSSFLARGVSHARHLGLSKGFKAVHVPHFHPSVVVSPKHPSQLELSTLRFASHLVHLEFWGEFWVAQAVHFQDPMAAGGWFAFVSDDAFFSCLGFFFLAWTSSNSCAS